MRTGELRWQVFDKRRSLRRESNFFGGSDRLRMLSIHLCDEENWIGKCLIHCLLLPTNTGRSTEYFPSTFTLRMVHSDGI